MTDRRPARARKVVDYTKFGGGDFDDDFADLTPPPSKRQKISNKDKPTKPLTTERKKTTKRAPLSEKVYERELQEALELSILESQGSNCDIDNDDDFKPKNSKKSTAPKTEKCKITNEIAKECINEPKKNEVICTVEVNKEKHVIDIDSRGIIEDNSKAGETTEAKEENLEKPLAADNHKILQEIKLNKTADGNESDGIVVLEDEVEEVGRGRRRSATKAKVVIDDSDDDEGSEFALDEESDDSSDNDYDEENDSDFDCGSKKTKANKKTPAPKDKPVKQSKTAPKKQTTVSSKVKPSLKPSSKPVITTKGPLSSPAVLTKQTVKSPACKPSVSSPVVRSIPKWNPPGSSGSVKSPATPVTIKSPSAGMRVGLSRNQRVRSLHPGLTLKTT